MKNWKVMLVPGLMLFLLINCTGNRPDLSSKQKRIISLSPHLTEIIYVLGAQKDLIAVSSFCLFPPEVKEKEKIGGLFDPNLEKILSLAPTHLFGVPSHQKLDQDLQKFNLHITMLSNETVAEVLKTIDTVGQILGYPDQARAEIDRIQTELNALKLKNHHKKAPTAMLVIGREAGTLQNLMVAGKQTFLNELWILAGGSNAFSDLPVRYATVNLEGIIERNPQLIIQFDSTQPRGIYQNREEPEWEFLKDVTAVQKKQIYIIGGDHVFIPGPRLTLLAEDFAEVIGRVAKAESPHAWK
jgi:iron complex transport system substrate-binding protein